MGKSSHGLDYKEGRVAYEPDSPVNIFMKKTSWFTVKRIHSKVYALAEFCHWEKVVSYLVIGKDKAILFDTGMGYENIRARVEGITSLPVKVLLTHAHWDHIGGAFFFGSVGVYKSPFEMNLLEQGFSSESIDELNSERYFDKSFQPRKYHVEGVKKITKLSDDDVISVGDFSIQVIHSPGHTPGSVCYLIPELDVLITGDTVYPGPIYLNLPESSLEEYLQSVKKLVKVVSGKTKVLPGHNSFQCGSDVMTKTKHLCNWIVEKKLRPRFQKGYLSYSLDDISILLKA